MPSLGSSHSHQKVRPLCQATNGPSARGERFRYRTNSVRRPFAGGRKRTEVEHAPPPKRGPAAPRLLFSRDRKDQTPGQPLEWSFQNPRKEVQQMTTDRRDPEREVRPEDLEAEQVTALPDREALSLVNANVAAPINAALALNVLSDGSVAYANAQQYAPIVQST